ncbi:MAG: toll/interleukin-1 receptor domain-containing protein [Pseudomonadota bacterium]
MTRRKTVQNRCDVFISYRRSDSPNAAWSVYLALTRIMPSSMIFFDVEDIQPGENFAESIESALRSCRYVLAIVGERWLEIDESTGLPRLFDEHDFVRQELRYALKNKKTIIPILFDSGEAVLKNAKLPEELKAFGLLNAIKPTHENLINDIQKFFVVRLKVGSLTYTQTDSDQAIIRETQSRLSALIAGFSIGILVAGDNLPKVEKEKARSDFSTQRLKRFNRENAEIIAGNGFVPFQFLAVPSLERIRWTTTDTPILEFSRPNKSMQIFNPGLVRKITLADWSCFNRANRYLRSSQPEEALFGFYFALTGAVQGKLERYWSEFPETFLSRFTPVAERSLRLYIRAVVDAGRVNDREAVYIFGPYERSHIIGTALILWLCSSLDAEPQVFGDGIEQRVHGALRKSKAELPGLRERWRSDVFVDKK